METVTIRTMRVEDAEAVAVLSASLGYPASAEKVRSRMEVIAGSKERLALAAVLRDAGVGQETMVGWIEASVEHHLQSESFALIGGLVVQEQMRGRGIGQQLCQAVEEWAAAMGIATVRVRSQQKRVDAHRFYLRGGYTQVKVSAVFEKSVLPRA